MPSWEDSAKMAGHDPVDLQPVCAQSQHSPERWRISNCARLLCWLACRELLDDCQHVMVWLCRKSRSRIAWKPDLLAWDSPGTCRYLWLRQETSPCLVRPTCESCEDMLAERRAFQQGTIRAVCWGGRLLGAGAPKCSAVRSYLLTLHTAVEKQRMILKSMESLQVFTWKRIKHHTWYFKLGIIICAARLPLQLCVSSNCMHIQKLQLVCVKQLMTLHG